MTHSYLYRITFLCFFISLVYQKSAGQTGAFMPSNADYSFPRTCMKSAEIPDVINYINSNDNFGRTCNQAFFASYYFPETPFTGLDQRRQGAHAAKNAAWFAFLGIKTVYPSGTIPLTPLEKDTLIRKSIALIMLMDTVVESFPNSDSWIYRSGELLDNLTAYDLLKGAGVPDTQLVNAKSRLIAYTASLYHEATVDIFGFSFFGSRINNHALRTAAVLGLAGIILNEVNVPGNNDRQAARWFHAGLFNIDNVLWRSSFAQSKKGFLAGYSEGPHYFRYGMKHSLAFFKAMKQFIPDTTFSITFTSSTRQIRHPWHDPDYKLLWEWAVRIRMPNDLMPPLEDSFSDPGFPELAMLQVPGYVFINYPITLLREEWSNWLYPQLTYSTDDFRAEFFSAHTPIIPDTFDHVQALPFSGNLILRSGWDTLSNYLHVCGKNGAARENSKGHNQADASSFLLSAHGRMMAIDPGYVHYNNRNLVDSARQHNMILVDGAGPNPGSVGLAEDADAFIEHAFNLGQAGYGEVRTAYLGASITRKFLSVRGRYFIDADRYTSTTAHNYQWRLHGWGLENGDSITGTFMYDSLQNRATWNQATSYLSAIVESANPSSISREINVHELGYLTTQNHTTLLANHAAQTQGHFLAGLFPYLDSIPQVTRLSQIGFAGMKISEGNFRELFIAQGGNTSVNLSSSTTGFSQDLSTAGYFTAFSESQSGAFQFFVTQGNTSLVFGPQTLYSSTQNLGVALEMKDNDTYFGHCSDSGSIQLFIPFNPMSVNGWGVDNWSYNTGTQILSIHFQFECEFRIHRGLVTANLPLKNSGPSFTLFPNPNSGKSVSVFWNENLGQEIQYELHDMNGKIFLKKHSADKYFQIDLSGLSSGGYLLRARFSDGKEIVRKLTVSGE